MRCIKSCTSVEQSQRAFLVRLGRNKDGFFAIVVVWVLIILTILAVGLGRRASIDMALARYSVGKVRSKLLATAGVMYAIAQVQADSSDAKSASRSCVRLYQCGFALKDSQKPEDIFHQQKLGNGFFDVYFNIQSPSGQAVTRYGLEDESGRLNLNAITATNYGVLRELLVVSGVEASTAETIARAVVDWRDADDEPFGGAAGAEKEYYASLGYPCKNAPFESPEEMMMVRGMTPGIFARIRPYVTVFPSSGEARVRVNGSTVSDVVLRALARNATDNPAAADSLVDKLIQYRMGDDGEPGTADDQELNTQSGMKIVMSADEQRVWQTMQPVLTTSGKFLRIHSRGVDDSSKARTDIEAVVERPQGKIIYWRRDLSTE